jgi:hypothetical protein
MKRTGVVAVIVLVLILLSEVGFTQGRSDREWQNNIMIYGVGPWISGDARLGPIELPVDVSLGDVFDNLQMGFMGAYRGNNERFSVTADLLYMGLGNSKETGLVRRGDFDLYIFDLTAGYRVSPVFEAYGGLRVTDISAKFGLRESVLPQARTEVGGSQTFYDPIFGARVALPLDQEEKWWFQAMGDVGGFGAGMTFNWQAMANVGFKPAEWISIFGGFRALGQDFENAGDREIFGMNVTYYGPQFGLGFHF